MKFYFTMYAHAIACMHLLLIKTAFCVNIVHTLPSIETMCRNQQVCSETTNSTKTTERNGCCTECSCQDDCHLHDNCCFDSTNKQSSTSRQYKTCVSTQFRESSTLYPFAEAFYVVTKIPEDGCPAFIQGQMSAAENSACCDTNVAMWGSYMPVTSVVTKTTYKNQNFAKCYGDRDTMPWLPYQMCDGFSSVQDTFSCNILFTFPGNPSLIKHDRCFTDTYGKCPDNFTVQSDLGLTVTVIREMCDSDFISPIRGLHPVKNVYCLTCILGIDPSRLPIYYCTEQNADTRTLLSEYSDFTSILDLNVISEVRTQQEPGSACEVYDGNNISSCRSVLCPLGQIRKGTSGTCLWMSQQWSVTTIRVLLKGELITSVDGLTNEELRIAVTSGKMKTPWKAPWEIVKIFTEEGRHCPLVDHVSHIKSNMYSVVNMTAKHLFFEIANKQGHFQPADFLSKIETNLLDDVEIDWRGEVIRLKQSVSSFSVCVNIDLARLPSLCFMVPHLSQYKNGTYLLRSASYYRVAVLQSDRRIIHLTHFYSKLLTCRQIEIREDEFVPAFFSFRRFTYQTAIVTQFGKVIYDGDFRLTQSASGVTAVRICLEDSGFVQIMTSSAPRYNHLFQLNCLTITLVPVLHIIHICLLL